MSTTRYVAPAVVAQEPKRGLGSTPAGVSLGYVTNSGHWGIHTASATASGTFVTGPAGHVVVEPHVYGTARMWTTAGGVVPTVIPTSDIVNYWKVGMAGITLTRSSAGSFTNRSGGIGTASANTQRTHHYVRTD